MIEKVKRLISRLGKDVEWRDFSCKIDDTEVSVFITRIKPEKRIARILIGSVPFEYTEHTIDLEDE